MFYWDKTFLASWVFTYSFWEKPFWLIGWSTFHPALNQVKMVEKLLAAVYHILTENSKKSIQFKMSTVSAQTGCSLNGWSQ